jgi:RNA polymerase sigma factor (sigma-70 family)
MAVMLTTPAAPSCSEHELVRASRRGDDLAFAELFSRYQGRITTYIQGRVRDHGRAEDITQEVFISALRRLRKTETTIVFKPWLYEIAKNACIDEHRRNTRAPEVPFAVEEELPGSDVTLRTSAPLPEEAIECKQRLDDLRGAFGGLSESHHRVLVMRELEGLSYAEIGQRLGMTRPMVESRLFRARRRLSEEYEELVSGRRCEQVQMAIDAAGPRALRSFGLRQRRQLSRHLAHCQPCRHVARMAGWTDDELRPRSIAARVAALLPFPLLRLRPGGRRSRPSSSSFAAHGAVQRVANVAQPLSSLGLGRGAAVAVAALALAGVGGGLTTLGGHHHASRAGSVSQTRAVTGAGTRPGVVARHPLVAAQTETARPISAAAQPRSSAPTGSAGRRAASRATHRSPRGAPVGVGGVAGPQSPENPASAQQLPVPPPAGLGPSLGAPKGPARLIGSLPRPQLPGAGSKSPVSPVPLVQAPKLPSPSSIVGATTSGASSSATQPIGSTASKLKLPSLP